MEDVQATLHRFLRAFSGLRLDEMVGFFADEATAFFPVRHRSLRLDGRGVIGEYFGWVLERVRASGATQLRLNAEDVHVQEFGDVAVVTFHVRDEELCRRTFVMRCSQGRWLIEHMHASNAPLPTSPEEA